MQKHPRITERRIQAALQRLQSVALYPATAPLQVEAFAVGGEPISVEAATQQKFQPFAVGEKWGAIWDTTWFRFSGTIPKKWRGRSVVALIDLGFRRPPGFDRPADATFEGFSVEGLVWRDGVPLRAVNVNRQDVPLAEKAGGGESFSFLVEAAANPSASDAGMEAESTPQVHGPPSFRLERAEMALVDPAAFALINDVRVALGATLALAETEPRRGQLLFALNRAVNLLDASDPATFPATREALREVLARKNGDSAHRLSAVGHAHIDTAWLWPLRETIRKCARTFSTQLAYMEEYPEYVFACSQPQQYAWMKEFYPTIYEGIRAAVKRGQWEPVGSMWIESDCNLPSGESLVRQLLHGKNFFLDEFGVETTDLWLPDVFGYSAVLPQLLKKAGVDYFMTQKIAGNRFNKFPHHTFLWGGLDGTRVFSHFPPAETYNGDFSPPQLLFNVRNFKEHDRANCSLYLFGHGDGGGGPTREMLETARRVRDFEGLPRVTLEKASSFFPKAVADAKDLPVWWGELDLEWCRGTYTTHARNKRGNRQSEFLLREAELFDSLVRVLLPKGAAENPRPEAIPHAVYDVTGRHRKNPRRADDLERAWKLVLLNQFHDIIPGSSIHWVHEDSRHDYETIRRLGTRVREQCLEAISAQIDTSDVADPILVFNPLSHARDEIVSRPDGTPVRVRAPSLGYAVVSASAAQPPSGVRVETNGGIITIDNGLLCLRLDAAGEMESFYDQRAQREVLAPGAKGNVLQLHRDEPNQWDAWEIDPFYRETVCELKELEKIEIVERHPLRVTVRTTRRFGKSSLVQNLIVRAGSPRIDFETEIDWQEEHRLLKVAFPVDVLSPRATYEIQYGHVERPTHQNTSWDLAKYEVCAHKWVDLSEGDYGVALLNDGKYGHDTLGSVLRLSLLRGSRTPDPRADLGHHRFTYSLLPHAGDFRVGKVVEEAYALNAPLEVRAIPAQKGSWPKTQSFFSVDRPGAIIEAVKKAERDDAIIVRLYEAYGTRGPVTLATSLPFKDVHRADLLERPLEKLDLRDGATALTVGPFEIVTLRFT